MKILAIDTTTCCCSCALSIDGVVVSKQEHIKENQHSLVLLKQVETVLSGAKLQLKQLTAIAIDIGPGSFTGVRVGVGVCQGLAYAVGCPVITVNSLETLASTVENGWVLSLLDARMQQVYCALYETQSYVPVEIHAPMVVLPADIPFDIEPRYQLLGNGNSIYASCFSQFEANNANEPQYPKAEYVARLAYHYGLERAVAATELSAMYIRNKVVN